MLVLFDVHLEKEVAGYLYLAVNQIVFDIAFRDRISMCERV